MASVVSVWSRKENLLGEIEALLPNVSLHLVENPDTDEQLKQSHILVADYDLLSSYLYKLPNAKWVQGTWAGVEELMKLVKPEQPPNFIMTRFSGRHFGALMSEYVIANIINQERRFFEIRENQNKSEWIRQGKMLKQRSINDLTIGIMGLGSIGNRIAKTLNYLGAKIIGFGRKFSFGAEEREYISEYYTNANLALFLRKCDYFINILPSTDETQGLLDRNVLENCKDRNTVFVNVGRGTIVSEKCLVEALTRKWLAGAILDVHEEEPLQKESPLWTMENVYISPHISGVSQPRHIAEHFVENYKQYIRNLPVSPLIDFSKGY